MAMINDVDFSDLYITPDKRAYIWSGKSQYGLQETMFDDYFKFLQAVEENFKNNPSYSIIYNDYNYRIERTISLHGPQFCVRKMPRGVPAFKELGMPLPVNKHMLSLSKSSGLILVAGATGSGKSTTLASLLKEYLNSDGGFALTIEDPIELPLDGVYINPKTSELGLCKQISVENDNWRDCLKSALRSSPRYIMLGEIRSPDVAAEALQAATSGHLVLSTIHANSVPDAISALVKYAAASTVSEEMAYELVASSILACLHQRLVGVPKKLQLNYLFANPIVEEACQVRGAIKGGKLNFSTMMEQQKIRLNNGQPLFGLVR